MIFFSTDTTFNGHRCHSAPLRLCTDVHPPTKKWEGLPRTHLVCLEKGGLLQGLAQALQASEVSALPSEEEEGFVGTAPITPPSPSSLVGTV